MISQPWICPPAISQSLRAFSARSAALPIRRGPCARPLEPTRSRTPHFPPHIGDTNPQRTLYAFSSFLHVFEGIRPPAVTCVTACCQRAIIQEHEKDSPLAPRQVQQPVVCHPRQIWLPIGIHSLASWLGAATPWSTNLDRKRFTSHDRRAANSPAARAGVYGNQFAD